MSLIRVLIIPRLPKNFHFSGPEPVTFHEVDWFRDDDGQVKTEEGRALIADFIMHKKYYMKDRAYLVLHSTHSFTINYEAP